MLVRCLLGRIAAATVFTVIAAVLTAAQTTLPVRQRTFEAVWKTVRDKYFDPTLHGVDWLAVRQRFEPRVASVASDAEFADLLDEMLDEIPVSHLNILRLDALDAPLARSVVTRGLALRDINGQVLVTRVIDKSPASRANLSPGFAVVAIDGTRLEDAASAEAMLAGDQKTHALNVVDGSGTSRTVSLEYALPSKEKMMAVGILTATRRVLVESRRLDDGIGYLYFTNFIEPVKSRLAAEITAMRDAPGLIIDLRGNSGGDTEGGLALASLLVTAPAQLAITRFRKGDDDYYKVKPAKTAYRGPVAILLDEYSKSESEQVSAGLQETGRVVVVGRRSAGEVMDATFAELPTDKLALLYPAGQPRTPKGTVIERRGVVPDIDVGLTRAGLLAGRDDQLDAAVKYIRDRANN
jgi:carboxyl-terminal processing protease